MVRAQKYHGKITMVLFLSAKSRIQYFSVKCKYPSYQSFFNALYFDGQSWIHYLSGL